MKNINDYKICKAIVSLENEVDILKNKIGSELPDGSIDLSDYVTNDGLATKLENYYTIEEEDDNFVINDYEKELSFTDGGIISNGQWRSVCYGNDMFVAVGFDGKCAWSTDGKTFTEGTSSNSAWFSVCYGNGMFVTITNGNSKCAWSTDGKTFTDGTIGDGYWYNVCYGNGVFVASGSDECVWSTDGKTFTKGTIGTGSWRSVCYGNGIFVTVSYSKSAWSTDGKTFTDGTIGTGSWYGVCYGNSMFVAVSNDGKCAWSTDGKTFTEGTISDGQWQNVCYGNGLFVVVSYISKCAWSTDGKTFIDGTISDNYWYNVCYGNGMFVTVSEDGKVAWSEFRIVTAKSFSLKEETYTKTESDERYTLKTELQQSMTITHLAPIDEELDINSFVIGAPVYMTGNVYVKDWENEIWNKSTINDSIDCISSVKTNGTWKEYLGICTSKTDKENGTEPLSRERVLQTLEPQSGEAANEVLSHNRGEIRFASHGDYLVKVSDSSKFNIGDTIYIDFGENSSEIKILTEDISLNTKIQRTTLGIITSILDETTVSVFKA